MQKKSESLADDLLVGVEAIAEFLGATTRRAYHLIESGQLPAFKLGGRHCARKSRILEEIERREQAGYYASRAPERP